MPDNLVFKQAVFILNEGLITCQCFYCGSYHESSPNLDVMRAFATNIDFLKHYMFEFKG